MTPYMLLFNLSAEKRIDGTQPEAPKLERTRAVLGCRSSWHSAAIGFRPALSVLVRAAVSFVFFSRFISLAWSPFHVIRNEIDQGRSRMGRHRS